MSKKNLIRKGKYILYSCGVHRFIPYRGMNFLGHLGAVSRWIADHRDLGFSSFPSRKFDYSQRFGLYNYVLETEIGDEAIDYLEFGVAKGTSFRWWLEQVKHAGSSFHGFDTFTGLPEDWGPFKKGDMSGGNAPPEIDDPRHHFYQGLFQKTLYEFLESYEPGRKKVILMDADLYSATLFVLTTLSPYLQKGDIIIFDDFNVPMHEFKAFSEWVHSFYINYRVLGEVNNYYSMAMRME